MITATVKRIVIIVLLSNIVSFSIDIMGEVVSIAHYINEVKIEQRVKDGFINATAMCVAYNKEIKYWLENKETFDLFLALINDLYSNRGNSDVSYKTRLSATNYQKMFPELLVVKQGSPEFGGGTWIHPDLAIQLAQWCNKLFALQVSRWVRDWFNNGFYRDNKELIELQREYELYLQRKEVRIELKDSLRPELMEVVAKYAKEHGISPITLCSQVHDQMNIKIQGYRSKQLKLFSGLPMDSLMRDNFKIYDLITYCSINQIAKNNIIDKGIEPIQATIDACDIFLGASYCAKPYQLIENINDEGKRIKKAIAQKKLGNRTNIYDLPLFKQS